MHAVCGMLVGALYGEIESGQRPVGQPEASPTGGRTAASPDVDAGAEAERDLTHTG